jgi:hypothetical protein
MSSIYSAVGKSTKTLWRGADQAVIDNLLKKYGPAPERL